MNFDFIEDMVGNNTTPLHSSSVFVSLSLILWAVTILSLIFCCLGTAVMSFPNLSFCWRFISKRHTIHENLEEFMEVQFKAKSVLISSFLILIAFVCLVAFGFLFHFARMNLQYLNPTVSITTAWLMFFGHVKIIHVSLAVIFYICGGCFLIFVYFFSIVLFPCFVKYSKTQIFFQKFFVMTDFIWDYFWFNPTENEKNETKEKIYTPMLSRVNSDASSSSNEEEKNYNGYMNSFFVDIELMEEKLKVGDVNVLYKEIEECRTKKVENNGLEFCIKKKNNKDVKFLIENDSYVFKSELLSKLKDIENRESNRDESSEKEG